MSAMSGDGSTPPPFSGSDVSEQNWTIYEPGSTPGRHPQVTIPIQPIGGDAPQPAADSAPPGPRSTPAASNLSPRQRRLAADAEEIASAFAGHQYVAAYPVGAQPPERYQVIYAVPALVTDQGNNLQVTHQHTVQISLPAGYPREKPYCTCDSSVFHPNFGNHICIADFWSPSQSLVDVIIQIGDMLQYKLYNLRSPLNAVAARWVQQHLDRVPISDINLQPPVAEVRLGPSGASR